MEERVRGGDLGVRCGQLVVILTVTVHTDPPGGVSVVHMMLWAGDAVDIDTLNGSAPLYRVGIWYGEEVAARVRVVDNSEVP